jgi:putative cell wall-binding protein
MGIESGTAEPHGAGSCPLWCRGAKERLMVKKEVKRWSQQVTETSNALDLEQGVFSWDDPRRIARSLKRSADNSDRRKTSAFHSAMSMLNFYVNRAGKKLPRKQREILEKAKEELREQYGKPRRQPS